MPQRHTVRRRSRYMHTMHGRLHLEQRSERMPRGDYTILQPIVKNDMLEHATLPSRSLTHPRHTPQRALPAPHKPSRHHRIRYHKCPRGTESRGDQCVECRPGHSSAEVGQQCSPCPLDTWSASTGSSSCAACEFPKTTTRAGSTACDGCEAGYYRDPLSDGGGWSDPQFTTATIHVSIYCDHI